MRIASILLLCLAGVSLAEPLQIESANLARFRELESQWGPLPMPGVHSLAAHSEPGETVRVEWYTYRDGTLRISIVPLDVWQEVGEFWGTVK